MAWVDLHAKFIDLLNTSPAIGKITFQQKAMLHEHYQSLMQNKTVQTLAIGIHHTKYCKGSPGNFKRYGTT